MEPASQPEMPTLTADSAGQARENNLEGKTLGDFRVLRRLGQGGMGQVYLAEQLSLKRKVALKILKADLASSAESLQRFKAEAEAVARVTHGNIVQVYAIGEQAGLHYMALEYVQGCNLREYLVRKGPPDVPLALSIMRQVAAGLQRAGELGLIHRDIKPENILLTRKGEVKVADFGLSRCYAGNQPALNLTQSGVTMGTPLYMSPEQVQGHPMDPRTDIYSFGVTCYHMLAGNPPYQGQTAFEVAFMHVQAQPKPLHEVRPDLPAELCAVIAKMMAKKPEDRYQSARELSLDLGRLRGSLTRPMTRQDTQIAPVELLQGSEEAQPTLTTLPRRRRRWLPWAVAGSILVASAGGAALGWQWTQKEEVVVEAPQQRHERQLTEAARLYDSPASELEQLLGLEHRRDLGLLYLEQRRFADAERFFGQLADEHQKVEAYRTLGLLGQGVVLAYQDKERADAPSESVKRFLEVFGDKPASKDRHRPQRPKQVLKARRSTVRWLVNRDRRFHQVLAAALERDAINLGSLPSELQELRSPVRVAPAGGTGKPGPAKRPDKP